MLYENKTKLLYSCSYDKTIKIWNIDSGKFLRTLTEHTYSIRNIFYDNNNNILFSGSEDKSIKVWNLMNG